MLEKVDLNKSVDKENYKKLREEMDVKLGELQRACKAEKIPVVIVFDGFDKETKRQELNGAFRDILSFEKQLADSGMILIKLFLYISRD